MAAKTPFDFINAIYLDQSVEFFDSLSDQDKKAFAPYVINMGLSMNPDYINLVNEANKYYDELDPRSLYLFYSNVIPKKKQFYKWIKKSNSQKYDDTLIEYVKKYFTVSTREALEYIEIFYKTQEGKEELRTILESFGLDEKLIKKLNYETK